jgi:hypothetical protein
MLLRITELLACLRGLRADTELVCACALQRRTGMLLSSVGTHSQVPCGTQIEGEFPELLGIKESLIKYVFEPNAAKKDEVRSAEHCAAGACMLDGMFSTCTLSHKEVFRAQHVNASLYWRIWQVVKAVKEMRGR